MIPSWHKRFFEKGALMDVYPLLALLIMSYLIFVYDSILRADTSKDCNFIAVPVVGIEHQISTYFSESNPALPTACNLMVRIGAPVLVPLLYLVFLIVLFTMSDMFKR